MTPGIAYAGTWSVARDTQSRYRVVCPTARNVGGACTVTKNTGFIQLGMDIFRDENPVRKTLRIHSLVRWLPTVIKTENLKWRTFSDPISWRALSRTCDTRGVDASGTAVRIVNYSTPGSKITDGFDTTGGHTSSYGGCP